MSSLPAFPIELLERPTAERLGYFRQKTIAHPHLVEAYERLFQAIQEPAGAALISVYGPSGVGKTTLRRRVEQRVTETLRVELERDPGRLAVVAVEAIASESADFNWRDFFKRALRAMDDPLIDHKVSYQLPGTVRPASRRAVLTERAAAPELRYALEQALRHRRPAAFLIDEAQHLNKVAGGRRLLDQLDTLKSLASMTGIVHVLLGTYELQAVSPLNLNPQIAQAAKR